MSDFVHLHLHTEYSLLDGATRISKIADKAISLGQSAVAITDHGVMYGTVEFYNSLKEKGVKPIIGCEVYVAARGRKVKESRIDSSGHHLVLLCKDQEGYRNLSYMVSMSFLEGFYTKPRIDMELLRSCHKGIIALSGCVGGKIPQLILAGSMSEAENAALELREIFGDDFYLEIQDHGMDEERRVAYGLKLISQKLGIPMVATNDVHYLEKNDAETQAMLMCIQTNNVITDGRPLGFEGDEYYFKSTEEMRMLFSSFPGAVENTVEIANKCNFDFEFNNLYLPDFEPEGGLTHKEKLRLDAYKGFEKRQADGRFDFSKNSREVYTDRIEYELSVIDSMGFNAYFLIVSDFVAYAKRSAIPVGPGRGSGAGSLVAFCIGITDVDPIAFDLLFERFLNPERVSLPDFDIDFCYNRRDEVIEYVKRRYGEDKVAQIVTFGTLAPRAAVRDVGRAMGMQYSKVDAIAKMISPSCPSLDVALENRELKRIYLEDAEVRRMIEISRGVEGMPRHASMHAAGVVITKEPTYTYVPLSAGSNGAITQFDMNTDAMLGLVKFDFLGLRYLTIINDAVTEIRKTRPDFSIDDIPLDDKKTFRLLCDAKTDGVFQLESGGMKQVLQKLAPNCIEDIIACIALYRPGPMDSIDTFIARKNGREKVSYKVELLSEILDVTYGCIVYQEQVMQIFRNLAGYSFARADIVRRAMSKKKESVMLAESRAFIEGCQARGISADDSQKIFEDMVSFAKYAFNKSHATAYGMISYRTAYLKAHYPAEYFSALLTSVLGNAQKLGEYIADANKFGVSVLPPDINKSMSDFSVADGVIRYGLLAIRNVGKNFADAVIRIRKNGEYQSFFDFVTRLDSSDLNKRTLEHLIKCGVFDSLGATRSSLLKCYESILESKHEKVRSNITGQLDLFSLDSLQSENSTSEYKYPDVPEFPLRELLIIEKESSGMYFSGHLIDVYSKHLSAFKTDRIADILNDLNEDDPPQNPVYKDKSEVTVAGIVTAKRVKQTKNNEAMAFVTLEDRTSEIVIIVFAKHYKELASELYNENAVCIKGRISATPGETPEIVLSELIPLRVNADEDDVQAPVIKPMRLYIKIANMQDKRLPVINRIAALNPGNTSVAVYDQSTGKYALVKDAMVDPSESVIARLKELFSDECIVLK